jgi:hypothetical protein
VFEQNHPAAVHRLQYGIADSAGLIDGAHVRDRHNNGASLTSHNLYYVKCRIQLN